MTGRDLRRLVPLTLSCAVIAAATLWPFRIADLSTEGIADALAVGPGVSGSMDVVRNVLLFVPFGYFAAARFGAARTRVPTLLLVCGVAAVFAYGLEVLQGMMPSRFPSLIDVAANVAGALVGAVIRALQQPTYRRWRPALYAAAVLLLAVPLNRAAQPRNWDNRYALLFGNEASGHRPWSGELFDVCFANRALALSVLAEISDEHPCERVPKEHLLVRYRQTAAGALARISGDIAADVRLEGRIPRPNAPELERDFESLSSGPAGAALAERIRAAGAMTLIVAFRPETLDQRGPARIVSLSRDADMRNFTIGQQGTAIVARLRTPLTNVNGTGRELRIDDAITSAGPQLAAFTYDGSTQCLQVNGRSTCTQLTPGVALARMLDRRLVALGPVSAWNTVYYAVMFAPLGWLAGSIGTAGPRPGIAAAAILAFAVGLELLSAAIPGRDIRWAAVAAAAAWGWTGWLMPRLLLLLLRRPALVAA